MENSFSSTAMCAVLEGVLRFFQFHHLTHEFDTENARNHVKSKIRRKLKTVSHLKMHQLQDVVVNQTTVIQLDVNICTKAFNQNPINHRFIIINKIGLYV